MQIQTFVALWKRWWLFIFGCEFTVRLIYGTRNDIENTLFVNSDDRSTTNFCWVRLNWTVIAYVWTWGLLRTPLGLSCTSTHAFFRVSFIPLRILSNTHPLMHTRIHAYIPMYVHLCTYIHIYVHIYVHTETQTYISMYEHSYIRTRYIIHTYI
jgi:hypothetical protein